MTSLCFPLSPCRTGSHQFGAGARCDTCPVHYCNCCPENNKTAQFVPTSVVASSAPDLFLPFCDSPLHEWAASVFPPCSKFRGIRYETEKFVCLRCCRRLISASVSHESKRSPHESSPVTSCRPRRHVVSCRVGVGQTELLSEPFSFRSIFCHQSAFNVFRMNECTAQVHSSHVEYLTCARSKKCVLKAQQKSHYCSSFSCLQTLHWLCNCSTMKQSVRFPAALHERHYNCTLCTLGCFDNRSFLPDILEHFRAVTVKGDTSPAASRLRAAHQSAKLRVGVRST